MWLRCFLCLLYLLQLVVLSGMVAAYISGISSPRPPAPSSAPSLKPSPLEAPLSAVPATKRHDKIRTRPVQVKMRPIHLSYLREHVGEVTSRLDLIRLFTDSDVDDYQLSRWMSRTTRSASLATSHGLKLKKERDTRFQKVGNPLKDFTVDETDNSSREEGVKSDPLFDAGSGAELATERDVIVSVQEVIRVEEEDSFDDHYFDYPQDEASEDDYEAFEAALHHIDEMSTCSASRCRDPKPFVQYVTDPWNRNRFFFPECTVLHRCMNFSGCCKGNQECVPKSMSIVTKSFLIADRVADQDDFLMFNPSMATTISFVNHTECECREKPKMKRCTKSCPTPFRQSREGDSCICSCFSEAFQDNWPCESIKEGVKPLSHDGLVCIKNGNCYVPQCAVGEFDIKSGLCPLSDDYSLPTFFFENPEERRHYRDHLRNLDFSDPKPKMTVKPAVKTTEFPRVSKKPYQSRASLGNKHNKHVSTSKPKTQKPTQASVLQSTTKKTDNSKKIDNSTVPEVTPGHNMLQSPNISDNSTVLPDEGKVTVAPERSEVRSETFSDVPLDLATTSLYETSSHMSVVNTETKDAGDRDHALDSKESSPAPNHAVDTQNKSDTISKTDQRNVTSSQNISGVNETLDTDSSEVERLNGSVISEGTDPRKLNLHTAGNDPVQKSPGEQTHDTLSHDGSQQGATKLPVTSEGLSEDNSESERKLPVRNKLNLGSHMSSQFHENFRPVRSKRPYTQNDATYTDEMSEEQLKIRTMTTTPSPLTTVLTSPLPEKMLSTKKSALPSPPPSSSSGSSTSSEHFIAGSLDTTPESWLGGPEDQENSEDRPVLEGLYSYDYAVLESSGEEFESSFV